MGQLRKCTWGMVIMFVVSVTVGCVATTPTRKQGEAQQAADYEQAYENEASRADSLAAANVVNHTKRIDLELKADLATLAAQAKADPVTWTPVAIAVETTRLQALHDKRIADYGNAMAASETLRQKNEAINLKQARALRDAMNPPSNPPQPVNLTGAVGSNAGTAPAPTTLIQP